MKHNNNQNRLQKNVKRFRPPTNRNPLSISRRAQEEIVGFILIVVILAVILVIILGISLNKSTTTRGESVIAYQYLESIMEQTTTCLLGQNTPPLKLDALISECYATDTLCEDLTTSCETLNTTLHTLLTAAWHVTPDTKLKGYKLSSIYSSEPTPDELEQEHITTIETGNCNNTRIGNSYISPEFPGTITTSFTLCY